MYPLGVIENSSYPRSGSPYCTPPNENACDTKNGPGSPKTPPIRDDKPNTSLIGDAPIAPSPKLASVAYDRISAVYRWNDALPPRGPPLNCAEIDCVVPADGKGRSVRVSLVRVAPTLDRKQLLHEIVDTRPVPP